MAVLLTVCDIYFSAHEQKLKIILKIAPIVAYTFYFSLAVFQYIVRSPGSSMGEGLAS